jgi:hypothetical protein
MGIEGPTLKCGVEIEEARLWPAAHFPRVPLLLEFAGILDAGVSRQARQPHTYVLWQYDLVQHRFLEVVRCTAHGIEWLDAIRAPALNALRDPERRSALTAAEAAKRVHEAVDAELRYLDFEARGHFLSRVYESAAGWLAHLD